MRKFIFLISFLLCHFALTAQNVYHTYGYPIFQGSSLNLAPELGLGELKMKTQDFISKNLDQAFVQKYLPKDQNIEFNIQYTIEANGMVLPESILVNTSVDFFNLKMKSVLVKLPRFIPAKTPETKETFAYILKFTPEFFVNQNNRLIPVYRQDLPDFTLSIPLDKPDLIEASNSLGYDTKLNSRITNRVHFRTNENKEITDVRIFTEHEVFSKKIKPFILNLSKNDERLFDILRKNTNYALTSYIFLTVAQSVIPGNETVVIYPGCENKIGNKEKQDCMSFKISNYVNRRFNKTIFKNIPIGIHKTRVFFKVNEKGNVIDVRVRAPYLVIEREVIRIISMLPQMTAPGMQEDKPVIVSYFLPININSIDNSSKF